MDDRDDYILDDLEQVRLLAHPLRSRILMAFCEGEFTTKQVAEQLGERPTRLYHHVEMLEKAGLVRKTRSRQNRGTIEQYFEAVAKSFQVDPQLFSGSAATGGDGGKMSGVLLDLFAGTGREMAEIFPSVEAVEAEEEALLGHVAISAEQEHIDELRRRINAVTDYIKVLSESEDGDEDKPSRHFRLALAFYPLDSDSDTDGDSDGGDPG